jgi:uncharacterized pyridoxamine 5'-phosphate oxidase family protein
MQQEDFYHFLNNFKLAVISTIHEDGRPESAVIGFGQTPDLRIIFGTDNTSRKYQNLSRDDRVAFTIGGPNAETVQYEGTAREMTTDELELVDEYYLKKTPESAKFRDSPTNRYFIVTPSWLRYTDLKLNPWNIQELKF